MLRHVRDIAVPRKALKNKPNCADIFHVFRYSKARRVSPRPPRAGRVSPDKGDHHLEYHPRRVSPQCTPPRSAMTPDPAYSCTRFRASTLLFLGAPSPLLIFSVTGLQCPAVTPAKMKRERVQVKTMDGKSQTSSSNRKYWRHAKRREPWDRGGAVRTEGSKQATPASGGAVSCGQI